MSNVVTIARENFVDSHFVQANSSPTSGRELANHTIPLAEWNHEGSGSGRKTYTDGVRALRSRSIPYAVFGRVISPPWLRHLVYRWLRVLQIADA